MCPWQQEYEALVHIPSWKTKKYRNMEARPEDNPFPLHRSYRPKGPPLLQPVPLGIEYSNTRIYSTIFIFK